MRGIRSCFSWRSPCSMPITSIHSGVPTSIKSRRAVSRLLVAGDVAPLTTTSFFTAASPEASDSAERCSSGSCRCDERAGSPFRGGSGGYARRARPQRRQGTRGRQQVLGLRWWRWSKQCATCWRRGCGYSMSRRCLCRDSISRRGQVGRFT